MSLTLTAHASARLRQRGIRESDVPVILDVGTPIDDDSFFLLDQDVDREIVKYKQRIAELERLRGCRVVIAGETVVTIYRPSRKTEKRLMRSQHRRGNSLDLTNLGDSPLNPGAWAHAT